MTQEKSTTATDKTSQGFTAEEQAAMKERAKELKAEARANKNRAAGESDLLAKIAEMPEPERSMATRLHEIISARHARPALLHAMLKFAEHLATYRRQRKKGIGRIATSL